VRSEEADAYVDHPEDDRFLIERELTVDHYEIAAGETEIRFG